MSEHNWPDMPDFLPEDEGMGEAFDYNTIINNLADPNPPVSPAPPPSPEKYPAQCPECQKILLTPMGMARHRKSTHDVVDRTGKVQCELESCAAWVLPGSIGRHMRNVHNVFGGTSGIARKRGKNKSKPKPVPTAEIEKTPAPVIDNGHKADKLPPLSAEQITRAAAEALWPEGIPHNSLTALLRWNIQTHYFLAEVTQ